MLYITADPVTIIENGGIDVLVHGFNCFHSANSSASSFLILKYPEILKEDIRSTFYGDKRKLSRYSICQVNSLLGKPILIVNAYVQYKKFFPENKNNDLELQTFLNRFCSFLCCLYESLKRVVKVGFLSKGFGDLEQFTRAIERFSTIMENQAEVSLVSLPKSFGNSLLF